MIASRIIPGFVFLVGMAFVVGAEAKCPSSIEEVGHLAPKILIQAAVLHKAQGIKDFSSEMEKSMSRGAASIGDYEGLYLVHAEGKSQHLSGVVKCDKEKEKEQLVVLSLSWNTNTSSGVMALPSK